MQSEKFIGWASQSSRIALAMGFAKTGCWFLAIDDAPDDFGEERFVFAHTDKSVVVSEAAKYDVPWQVFSQHEAD